MNRFDTTTASPNYIEATKEIPKSQTIHSDVLVPLFYSGALGLGVSGLALLLEATERPAAALGLGVALVAFVVQGLWNRDLLMTTETVLRHDFDGDGHIGKPVEHVHSTNFAVRIEEPGRNVSDIFAKLDMPAEKVASLFQDMLNNNRERKSILPSNKYVGKLLSRTEWETLTEWMDNHKLSQYRNSREQNGRELTARGEQVFDGWLERYTT